MAEGTIRISKVLKEFNIGIGTLSEFLKKKNIDVEVSPVAKISDDVYALVAKEFGKEQLIKEQSKKVAIKVKEITEMESKKSTVEEAEPVREVIIKTNVLTEAPARKQEPAKVSEQTVETPVNAAEATVTEPVAEPKKELKVLGKIDLNPKKSEKKAETAAQVKSEPEPAQVKVEKAEKIEKPEKPVIEHIETKVEKLSGPKISGTIDLSQFEKKPSQNADKKDKGKRERIHKNGMAKVDVNKAGGTDRQPKQKQNDNQNAQGKGKFTKKDRFKAVHTEIDDDEIQKQIKETYARMVEGKGKTKTSKHRREKREEIAEKMQEEAVRQEMTSNVLKVTEFVTVNELAILMNNTPVTKVIEACMNLGLMVSINQRLDAEALVLVAEEFGYKIEFVTAEIQGAIQQEEDKEEDLVARPPIVTVMGHVDHGKTSLLDYIRKTNVIAGEAGGITQHIGAYNVSLNDGRHITFLDTPGHEAFTAMRARGAKVTDLAIIIIAADDAVMPQTIEAINHAQAAGVPMIFAINKIDKPGANPEKIKEQLANMNILVEDWGGKYQCQEIAAKKGINVELLLEKVLLEADLLELKANPDKLAVGNIIESSLDKGRGYLATVLVQSGTLHVGDPIVAGCYSGRVKAMFNERGQKLKEAGPSTPVSVLGLNGAPTAGDTLNAMEDEKEARDIANKREQLIRIQGIKTQTHITLEEIGRRIALGNFQELNIIVKADVDGSIEALSDSLIKLSTEEIHVNVIHKAVGAISESDVLLAVASNAIIIGFQVRPMPNARKLAEKEQIEIRLYSVIYDAIEEVKSGIEGMLAPEQKEEVTANAEVLETFKISKVGTIAGCMVRDGKMVRNAKVRVIRDGIVVYTGVLGSLKRLKDDVKEVAAGFDCGLSVDGFNDVKVGDIIEAYQIVEIKRKL
jgi:translation initiation factor IF-2